jgi:hypothetical protein
MWDIELSIQGYSDGRRPLYLGIENVEEKSVEEKNVEEEKNEV